MKMTTLLAELGDVVREFKEKNPKKSLGELEVFLSTDEEGNAFHREVQIAWTDGEERTQITFYPIGEAEPEEELTPEEIAAFEKQQEEYQKAPPKLER